jgi:hypothetical protein
LLTLEIVLNHSSKGAPEGIVAALLTPDPAMTWLRPETSNVGDCWFRRPTVLAQLKANQCLSEYILAFGERQPVLRSLYDVAQGLLDSVAYHGVANDAVPPTRIGEVQRAGEFAGDRQTRGNRFEATFVSNF